MSFFTSFSHKSWMCQYLHHPRRIHGTGTYIYLHVWLIFVVNLVGYIYQFHESHGLWLMSLLNAAWTSHLYKALPRKNKKPFHLQTFGNINAISIISIIINNNNKSNQNKRNIIGNIWKKIYIYIFKKFMYLYHVCIITYSIFTHLQHVDFIYQPVVSFERRLPPAFWLCNEVHLFTRSRFSLLEPEPTPATWLRLGPVEPKKNGSLKKIGIVPGWWQLKYVLCSSLFGEMIHFDTYFSNGLKPPTRDPPWN